LVEIAIRVRGSQDVDLVTIFSLGLLAVDEVLMFCVLGNTSILTEYILVEKASSSIESIVRNCRFFIFLKSIVNNSSEFPVVRGLRLV